MRKENKYLEVRIREDGLITGDWITVADPWQDEWPFAKRHPRRTCPSDPEHLRIIKV